MFSRRTDWDRTPNELSLLIDQRRRQGRELLDLTESNPTRAGLQADPAALAAALGRPANTTYEPHPQGLAEARATVAAHLAQRGLGVDPAHVFLTASTSEAYSSLFKLLCDPGDAVLVPRPSYPLFDFLARLDGVEVVPYRLRLADRWELHVEDLAASLPENARAVLVVNPNNPTGSFVSQREARDLAALCAERGLALVSDEVFSDFAWPRAGAPTGPEHAPTTSLLPAGREAGALTAAMSGLSKSCGLPQLKLAWIALAGDEALLREACERLELVTDTYLSVSTPPQVGLESLLRIGETFRQRLGERLEVNRRTLDAVVAGTPGCRVLPAEGGWYAIVELPPEVSEQALVHSLVEDDGVLVHPGYFFDLRGESHVVVSLLCEERVLREGAERLAARLAAPLSRVPCSPT